MVKKSRGGGGGLLGPARGRGLTLHLPKGRATILGSKSTKISFLCQNWCTKNTQNSGSEGIGEEICQTTWNGGEGGGGWKKVAQLSQCILRIVVQCYPG